MEVSRDLRLFQDSGFDPVSESVQKHMIKLNEIVQSTGECIEGNICYYHFEQALPDGPDPRYQHKRFNFAFFALGGRRILEIGFNAGHSALLALCSNSDLSYYGVDHATHSYTVPCFQYLKGVFGSRIDITLGDSRAELPKIANLARFDLFHLDGGHDFEIVNADLANIIQRASPGSRLLCDDMTGEDLRLLCDYYVVNGSMIEIRPALWKGKDQSLFRII